MATHLTKDTTQLFGNNGNNNSAISESKTPSFTDNEYSAKFPVRIPFKCVALITGTCQIFALVFCLTWSIKFNFYESTATHCHVVNFLPSISATLEFTPQRDIWITVIGLFSGLRYFIAYLYYQLIYRSKWLFALHCLEITALLGLSIVDSLRFFAFHAICVTIFLFTTVVHEFMVCLSIVKAKEQSCSLTESTIFTLSATRTFKTKIAICNFITLTIALYLYYLHNTKCIAGVYSMFSALEYFVIIFNIVYHLQAYHDLGEYSVVVMNHDVYIKESTSKIY